MTDHPDPRALADHSAGLPDAAVAGHLEQCGQCRDRIAEMAEEVRGLLRGAVEEPMPLDVLQGLLVALDAESDRRRDGGATRDHAAAIQEALDRTDQGSFGSNPLHQNGRHRPQRKPRRTVEH